MPPHLLDPNGYAQSPVGQLSRSNAVLMRENQQLTNRVQDLENSLRDHVAHLNSVYFTLHQRYGFDALQLPGGELVHLSQFKGPEVVLLTFVHNPKQQYQQHRHSLDAQLCLSPTPLIDETQKQISSSSNRRNRLLLLQQKQQQLQQIRHKQPPLLSSLSPSATSSLPSQFSQQHSPPSTSSDSACYSSASVEQQIVSGPSSTESSSLSAAFSSASSLDPVEMLRQLCIRSSIDQQSTEQIQGYVGWLKEQENGEDKEEEEKQRLLAYFRAQQVQAQVQQPLNNENKRKYSINTLTTASSDGWRSARSETVPSTSEQQIEENCEKPPSSRATWPPRFPLMNKTRKFRSIQFLGNRRSTSSSSVSPHPTGTTTALLSGNHRGNSSSSPRGLNGIGRHSPLSSNDERRNNQKTTRRGIGPMATAACRNTLRIGGDSNRGGTKRNLL
uniref:CCDC92 domain-containing protein n=1 Tax=Meloidogyne hapla TaxID=6305 RepID=A0A1I8BX10_MELHA